MDPLKAHNDAKLLDALKKARLADVVRHKLAPLDPVEGGRGLHAMVDYETTFSAGNFDEIIIISHSISIIDNKFVFGYFVKWQTEICLLLIRSTAVVVPRTCHSFFCYYRLCGRSNCKR